MSEQRSYDAIIVGAGAIGLSCAWRAAGRGARIAVLERAADTAAGATRVAAGMLAPVGELAFGEPELLRMNLAAAELFPEFVEELEAAAGMSTGYASRGALHIALDRDEAAELRRIHDLQRALGLGAEWLPPRRCRELEPALTPSFNGGVHVSREAAIDPRAMSGALVAACEAAGVELRFESEVTEGLFDGDRLVGVRANAVGSDVAGGGPGRSGEELRADSVVLACGAWSGRAEWLPEAARPPVRPVKGQAIELRSRDGAAPCERIIASERVYLVPRSDGRLIVGATVEEQGFDTAVTAGGAHELLREAYRLLPEVAEMELLGAVAGLRPGSPDNLPLIGRAGPDGLLWATGHYRNGILLAPLTAVAIAALLDGGSPPEAALAADPVRFDSNADAASASTLASLTGKGEGR